MIWINLKQIQTRFLSTGRNKISDLRHFNLIYGQYICIQDVLTLIFSYPNSKYTDLYAPGVDEDEEELTEHNMEDFKCTAM